MSETTEDTFTTVDDLKVPTGDYYVIDPCYVVRSSDWDDFCDVIGYDGVSAVMYRGTKIIYWSTRDGDGCYPVYDEGVYRGRAGVDAGMLSLISKKDADNWGRYDNCGDLGVEVTVHEETTVEDYGEGNVQIGEITVITGEDPDRLEHLEAEMDNILDTLREFRVGYRQWLRDHQSLVENPEHAEAFKKLKKIVDPVKSI